MKKLYSFQVSKWVEKDVPTPDKDKDGKDITVLKKEKLEEKINYFIKKPNRAERNEAELFETIEFSNLVRQGVITRSEVIKRFTSEDIAIEKTYKNYSTKENELQRLSLQEKTPELSEKILKLQQELFSILLEIQDFELTKSSVFNRTADTMARNKSILWWILNLAYRLDGDKELAVFEGKDFHEKQESCDQLLEKAEENRDLHVVEVWDKFRYFVSAWYGGQAVTDEDFKKLEDILKAEIKKQEDGQKELDAERLKTDLSTQNKIDEQVTLKSTEVKKE